MGYSIVSGTAVIYSVDTTIPLSVPSPIDGTDITAGGSIESFLSPNGYGPARGILEIATDTAVTLDTVTVYLFQAGKWRIMSVAGSGLSIFATIDLTVAFPASVRLNDFGRATRLCVSAGVTGGPAIVTMSFQRVDDR